MPNTLEEASRATEDMFANIDENDNMSESQPEESVQEDTITDQTEQLNQEQQIMEEATQTAEVAAQVAAEKDAELTALRQQMDMLQQQNSNMSATIEELSKKNEEHIVEQALEPPVLDISSLALADEDTIRNAQMQYAQDMANYNRQAFMQEFAPVIEQANKQKLAEEKKEVISALSQIPELQGIDSMTPQMDMLIQNNKWLADVPTDERYILAYALARGIDSINTPPAPPEEPKEPTAEELLEIYNKNPAFQELVEKQRLDTIKQSQQVPPMSASSGAAGAALNIKEKPQTLEEASRRTREMFSTM